MIALAASVVHHAEIVVLKSRTALRKRESFRPTWAKLRDAKSLVYASKATMIEGIKFWEMK